MSSLFRSLHNFSSKKENSVKEALTNTLSENWREFWRWKRRPEPSFWPPLMVFLHKQVIEQIQSLSQINSEIGLCRAWIRQSLNESLISSYFKNIRKNSSALSPYYKKYALLKDAEGLETAEKILSDIEAQMQFKLPVNSSLLNQWPDYALQMSGLWTPPLKSCPISSGIDIACSLAVETQSIPTPQPVPTNELFSESISNSPFSRRNFSTEDLNQRENLDLFLQKIDEMAIIDEENVEVEKVQPPKESKKRKQKIKIVRKHSNDDGEARIREASNETEETLSQAESGHGNSIRGNSLTNLMQTSWSSDINQVAEGESFHERKILRSISMTSSTSSLRSPLGDRCSYNALLKKHECNRDMDWTEIWEKFLVHNTNVIGSNNDIGAESDENQSDTVSLNEIHSDFEVIQHNTALEKFDIVELQGLVEQLCKLPREPGLDAQGFLCKSCQHPLGIGYTNFRVCAFSGHYYCDTCMNVEPVYIPSRIIYNWDFRKFAVSKRAMTFLSEFRCQPFIDLKLLNPLIYNAAEAMAELQSLRIRLNFLRAYLYTCAPASIGLFQHLFLGKEYLYEHIHHYSIGDLSEIQRGILYTQLQKAYKIGESHVLKCALCSVKGFICEICNSPRVLYPFHIDTTYRCETCGAVFHAHCLNSFQPCPKCERKRKREDLSSHEIEQVSEPQ